MVPCVATRKVTITLPDDVLARLRDLAGEHDVPLSTYLAHVAEHHSRVADGLAALREWEAEEGPLTDEEKARARTEIAWADSVLADAGQASA